jgi:ATPase subunit of ABC transporter with duplicated ATPase domains
VLVAEHIELDRLTYVLPDGRLLLHVVSFRIGDGAGAEALQQGLAAFAGTVLAVTHDRWFAADFDRFLIFGADGTVQESAEPVWEN